MLAPGRNPWHFLTTTMQRRDLVMEDLRFDALTRALATGRSRRQVLRALIGVGAFASGGALTHDADAARRGYSGPGKPPVIGPCQPFCPPGACGMSDGCRGTCSCSTAGESCILQNCAPPCDEPPACDACLHDGPYSGCFHPSPVTCSDTKDCQVNVGLGVCMEYLGQMVCYFPDNGT